MAEDSKLDKRIDKFIEKNLRISHEQWERTGADTALDKLIEKRHEGQIHHK